MKRTGRQRLHRAIKWSGLYATIAALGLWTGSVETVVIYYSAPVDAATCIGIGSGTLTFRSAATGSLHRAGAQTERWQVRMRRPEEPLLWRPYWYRYGSRPVLEIIVPLWMPVLGLALPTAWLWYRDRRSRPGHCPCGYSLTGLAPGAPCPECGKAAA